LEKEIESGAHHFALRAQQRDLKNVGNLCDEPEGCSAIFTRDLFQYIDSSGSSSVWSINTGAFIWSNPGTIDKAWGTASGSGLPTTAG